MLAGMSEYHGSEGFDRPPSDVYCTRASAASSSTRAATSRAATRVAPSAMTGLGRERLSPWYDMDCVFVCVCV